MSCGHYDDALRELGYDTVFDYYFEEIPQDIGEELTFKSTSLTLNGKPLQSIKKEMRPTDRTSHYIGMEIFSLDDTDIASIVDGGSIEYSTGELTIPLSLVSPEEYYSDKYVVTSAYSYHTNYGVTLMAYVAIENGILIAELYPIDMGEYNRLVSCRGEIEEHIPYLLVGGRKIYGQFVDIFKDEYRKTDAFRYEFNISEIGAGDIKLCYDSVCVLSDSSVTVSVSVDTFDQDTLESVYDIPEGSLTVNSIKKERGGLSGENMLRVSLDMRSNQIKTRR